MYKVYGSFYFSFYEQLYHHAFFDIANPYHYHNNYHLQQCGLGGRLCVYCDVTMKVYHTIAHHRAVIKNV